MCLTVSTCPGEPPLSIPPSPWREHAVVAAASMANPPRVSRPKTETWRKGSKIGFPLRTVSSACNEKAFNEWVVKACFSAYGLDRLQRGSRLQTVSPARRWGWRLLYSHYSRGKSTFLAWIIWKLWISLLFLFQRSTDKSCVKWSCCLSVRQL